MGGGGFGRAYASGSNTKINQAALLKAAARAPKTVASVIKDQFVPYSPDWKKDFTDPAGTERKAGETVDRFNAAGDKVGFTMYLDKPVYDGYGNITSTGVRTKHVPFSEDRVVKKTEADPDFNVADYYEATKARADKAITPEATRKVLTSHDPNRGALMGTSPRGYLLDQQVGDPFIETIRSKQIPLTKKLDTPFELDYDYGYHSDKLYMKQPPLEGNLNLQQGFTDKEREEYRDLMKRGSFVDISGGTSRVGEYTMAWVEDPPEPSGFSKFLNNPVLSVIGAINPVIGLATTGVKLATGEKVSPMEIASGLMTGLNMAGVTKPPSLDAMPAGQVGTPLPNKGTGLFGSTYGQTQTALNVAAAGDAQGAALSLLGPQAVKAAIDKVPDDRILNVLQKDDVQAGLTKVVERVAGGAEFDEALAFGLGTYIKEGGGLNIEGTDVSLGVIEDVVRDVVRPIGKVGTEIAKFVENAVPDVDTSALDPIEDAIRQAGRTTEDVVRAGGRAVDQAVIQPTREVAKAFDDAVIQPVGDAFSALDTAVRQALPSTSIDLPSLNIPNFNPNLGQFGLQFTRVSDTGEPATQPSSTRTTDALFGDELFKFKTPIEDTQERLDYIDLNSPFDQSQELELELTYPDSTEESDGFFEGTIYEQQPRSYNF